MTQRAPRSDRRVGGIDAVRSTLVGLLILFAASLLLSGSSTQPVGPLATAVFLVTSIVAGVACWFPADAGRVTTWGWRLVSVRAAFSIVATVLVAVPRASTGDNAYPAAADWIVLAGFPMLYVAAMLLVTAQVRHLDVGAWLDGIIVAVGIAALANAVLLAPLRAIQRSVPISLTILLGQPVADLGIVLAVCGAILTLRLVPSRGLRLLLASVAVRFVGDALRLAMEASGTNTVERLVAFLWLSSAVLAAVGARVRSSVPAAVRTTPVSDSEAWWRGLALPGGAALGSLAILAVAQQHPLPLAASSLALVTLTLALARTALTFYDVLSLSDVHAQARTDDLTGLPNRRALFERADALFRRRSAWTAATVGRADPRPTASAARPDRTDDTERSPAPAPTSLVIVDLDRFKEINDSLGHAAGDVLLVQVGERIGTHLRSDDLLARLGGDEFALLLPGTSADGAVELARTVRKSLEDPFVVGTTRLHVDASFGVATTSTRGGSRAELMRCADVAMYDAKHSGSGISLYSPVAHDGVTNRVTLLEDLRSALTGDPTGGELVMHLQPQMTLGAGSPADQRVHGMEALVRWLHPTYGLLLPGRFLPLAEGTGLMRELGYVVGERALDACRTWWDLGYRFPVSINLSAADMHDEALPERIAASLASRGLPASALVIEVTEHSLMADSARVRPVLERLRASGVAISIDDYGTGFSSLAYLRRLPLDELKLDRLMVADVHQDTASAAIVRHTVGLAHSLGLRLVAEGIEVAETRDMLADLGCDVGQGYLFARPMPTADVADWLAASAAPPR